MSITNLINDIPAGYLSFILGLFGIIIGAFFTSWLAKKRDILQRKNAFIEKQLKEFYSPILGLRLEIRTHSELRVKLQGAASGAWSEYCDTHPMGPEHSKTNDEKFKKYEALIKDDNEKFRNITMPGYNKMLDLFRDNLWLVEEETRSYYPILVEFVDVWNRNLKDAIPYEVVEKIGHGEANLNSFYEHIVLQHDKLRNLIKQGKA